MYDARAALDVHGIRRARELVADKDERVALETAARFRQFGSAGGIVHLGLLTAALPHKQPSPGPMWQRDLTGARTLHLFGAGDRGDLASGVPYGAKARMMLFHLQDQLLRTEDRRIALGSSMSAWLRRIGKPGAGGMTYKMVGNQWRRLATTSFAYRGEICASGPIIELMGHDAAGSGTLDGLYEDGTSLPSDVTLSEAFAAATVATRLSVSRYALYCLSNNSAALDTYLCLSWSLPRLQQQHTVAWGEVATVFGKGFKNPLRFRPTFVRALQMALAVYPQAKVNVSAQGLTIHPSADPVQSLCT